MIELLYALIMVAVGLAALGAALLFLVVMARADLRWYGYKVLAFWVPVFMLAVVVSVGTIVWAGLMIRDAFI